jgi:hypothetical protein
VALGLVVQWGSGAPARAVARTPVGGSAIADLRRIDRIALTQLRRASRELARCVGGEEVRRSPAGLSAYRGCARWPLAHVVVDGKANGSILYGIGQRIEHRACRALVFGRANDMKLLSADADALVRGLWDASRKGRHVTGGGAGSITGFLRALRRELLRTGLGACGSGGLSTRA